MRSQPILIIMLVIWLSGIALGYALATYRTAISSDHDNELLRELRKVVRELLDDRDSHSRVGKPCDIVIHPVTDGPYCLTHTCISGIYDNMCALRRARELLDQK